MCEALVVLMRVTPTMLRDHSSRLETMRAVCPPADLTSSTRPSSSG